MIDPDAVAWDERGLAPTVVQDATSRRVLMVAWMDRTALAATIASGQAHFWSRSRGELWRKGATSGDTMEVTGLALDCDGDTVLMSVSPAGPACHTGSMSCFDTPDTPTPLGSVLDRLQVVVAARAEQRPKGSYTVELVDAGVDRVARKLLEEAGELAFIAKDRATGRGSQTSVAEEAADLLYHLLVLLQACEVPASAVATVLEERAR
jgi:phosphoribosyl-AMP cyclohydrolase / phosphoribosyl-ATP pyrophosphohydrolase